MKKIFLLAIVCLLASCEQTNTPSYSASTYAPSQPEATTTTPSSDTKFDIEQDLMSIGSDFTISTGGKVEERIMNFTPTFEYSNNGLIAKAQESMFSWGVEIIVTDAKGSKIGSINEELFSSLFSMSTTYTLKDANNNVIGKSKKLDFIGTDIDIYDNTGALAISMERPMFNLLTDTWHVTIHNSNIDKRIIMFIPCYKTYADDKRKDEEDDEKKDRN